MPPKAKVTKDMIIDAAFEVARESGVENIKMPHLRLLVNRVWKISTLGQLQKS